MSVVGVTRLVWDLKHIEGVLDRYREDADAVMSSYDLTDEERADIHRMDPYALLARGINPIIVRGLFVNLGIPHAKIFAREATA